MEKATILEMGKRIKERRKEINMSQDELAKRTGYSGRSAISKIETEGVDLPQSKITKFAEVLGVSPLWIIGKDVQKNDDYGRPKAKKQPSIDLLMSTKDGVDFLVEIYNSVQDEKNRQLIRRFATYVRGTELIGDFDDKKMLAFIRQED